MSSFMKWWWTANRGAMRTQLAGSRSVRICRRRFVGCVYCRTHELDGVGEVVEAFRWRPRLDWLPRRVDTPTSTCTLTSTVHMFYLRLLPLSLHWKSRSKPRTSRSRSEVLTDGVFIIAAMTVSACLSDRTTTRPNFSFCVCMLPWVGPPLTASRYVMYVRFCGCRHVFTIILALWRVVCTHVLLSGERVPQA